MVVPWNMLSGMPTKLTGVVLVMPFMNVSRQWWQHGAEVSGEPARSMKLLKLLFMHPVQNLRGATLRLMTRSCELTLDPALDLDVPVLLPFLLPMCSSRLKSVGGLFTVTV